MLLSSMRTAHKKAAETLYAPLPLKLLYDTHINPHKNLHSNPWIIVLYQQMFIVPWWFKWSVLLSALCEIRADNFFKITVDCGGNVKELVD